MNPLTRLMFALKSLRQLGVQQVGLYALYKFGLLTGHYARLTSRRAPEPGGSLQPLLPLPDRDALCAVLRKDCERLLLAEADEIVAGKVRLFGGEPVSLLLELPGPLSPWTDYEIGKVPLPIPPEPADLPAGDVKRLWEPARFGWAFTLGRAYHLTGEERYATAFWGEFETFTAANPPCLGPNWSSGQEVSLRLIAFAWAGQVFAAAPASTPGRLAQLAASVVAHAGRIPPTLLYARSQHNNHLLTEAAGLLTAALALPACPQAARWRALGWRWLNRGLQAQIDSYGEYSQHSTNYHRLMLQVALWVNALLPFLGLRWPPATRQALMRSVHWMLALMDDESGQAPNLGANDGAYIFPFTSQPFADQRPVLYAAARAFLDYDLPRGPWDEMALWFGVNAPGPRSLNLPRYLGDQMYGLHSWAYFRTAQYNSRPSHADQLHLDLWWRGVNLAQDAGTYLYNADPPWENALAAAFLHNTVTVNDCDQMTRAGRFLYLDWVNAYRRSLPVSDPAVIQCLRGRYWGHGYRHTRIISVSEEDRWLVRDELLPQRLPWRGRTFSARLHWLLPDLPWHVLTHDTGVDVTLESSHGPVVIHISYESNAALFNPAFSIVRAGQVLHGDPPPDPVRGWTSPTYGIKIPALSLAFSMESTGEIVIITQFSFPPVHP